MDWTTEDWRFNFNIGKRFFFAVEQVSYTMVAKTLSQGVNHLDRKANQSLPSSVENKNEWALSPFPHTPSWRVA